MVEQGNLFREYVLTPRYSQRRESGSRKAVRRAADALRFCVAAIFSWFGMLMLTGVSPLVELIRNSMPALESSPHIELLGIFEVAIGLGLIIDRFARHASALMMLNLVAMLSLVLIAPALIFAPSFPELTVPGQFLVHNVVLVLAGLMVLSSRQRQFRKL